MIARFFVGEEEKLIFIKYRNSDFKKNNSFIINEEVLKEIKEIFDYIYIVNILLFCSSYIEMIWAIKRYLI